MMSEEKTASVELRRPSSVRRESETDELGATMPVVLQPHPPPSSSTQSFASGLQATLSARAAALASASADRRTRTLRGLDDLTLRGVIPTVPVRSTPFQLDRALANLEAQLTGGASSSGPVPPGQLAAGAPTSGVFPTNFYISWPESSPHLDAQRASKNNWISPRDLLVEKTPRPKTAAEFPAQLTIHKQRHQPGLLNFQPGDLVSPRMPDGPAPASARRYTNRLLSDSMAERDEVFTGAKPRTAGERNRKVGPGSYDPPRTSAVLSRSANTFKPKPPKTFDERGLIQGPAPGSYSITTIEPRVPALHFGGTQKTHSRAAPGSVDLGPGAYERRDPVFGGEPKSLIMMRSARFPDTSGAGNTGAMAIGPPIEISPGPGSYNVALSSCIGSSASQAASFSARGGGSGAALAVSFKRSSGPAVGSYSPSDGGDIGSSSVVGSSGGAGATSNKSLHKFPMSARFDYQSRPHPLYALVISDAKKRQQELTRSFKPSLADFHSQRKEELLIRQREQREQRHSAAVAARHALRMEHMQVVDRIVNKDLYRAQERDARNYEELQNYVRRGWAFYIALGSRMQLIKENIRRVRTAKNLRLLTTNAARTIVNYARKWLAKAHANKVTRSAGIILRALRRNVVRASLRRKLRAARCITILLLNQLNKRRALHSISCYRRNAILIQRAVRAFLLRKQHACTMLLARQWDQLEGALALRYKTSEGERAFEKIRKKGLLIKNLPLEAQRANIIREVPFDFVDARLKREMIEEDYTFRLRAFRAHKYEWIRMRRKHDGMPDMLPIVEAAKQAKVRAAQLAAEEAAAAATAATAAPAAQAPGSRPVTSPAVAAAAATNAANATAAAAAAAAASAAVAALPPLLTPEQLAAQASARAASIAAEAVASGLPPVPPFDPSRLPYFHRLIPPLRVFSLITQAQARQAAAQAEALGGGGGAAGAAGVMDPEVKKKYKKMIGSILKSIQAREAKERKAQERAAAEAEQRSGAEAASAASAKPTAAMQALLDGHVGAPRSASNIKKRTK